MCKNKCGNFVDAVGVLGLIALPVFVWLFIIQLNMRQVKNLEADYKKPFYTLRGVITKVETWELPENPSWKEGNATVTMLNKSKTKIVFADGRTKELHGFPKGPAPKDEAVVIANRVWLLLEIVDAQEYDARKK